MLASASGELKTRSRPNSRCRPSVALKTPPLPRHLGQDLRAAGVRHVLAEDDDAGVALHLVPEGPIDGGDHRFGRAGCVRCGAGLERGGSRVDRRRVDVQGRRRRVRLRGGDGAVRCGLYLAIDVGGDRVEVGLGCVPRRHQEVGEAAQRIARRLRFPFGGALVVALVVRHRMRVGARDTGMDERRSRASPRPGDRFAHRPEARHAVRSVDADDVQAGERLEQLGDVAARRLHLDRDGDGVPVVFDQVDDRQPAGTGRVERFPELAAARLAVTERNQGHLTVQRGRIGPDADQPWQELARLGGAYRMETLRRACARRRHDSQGRRTPVRRHLSAAGVGIVPGAHRVQQHVAGGESESQAQSAVPGSTGIPSRGPAATPVRPPPALPRARPR